MMFVRLLAAGVALFIAVDIAAAEPAREPTDLAIELQRWLWPPKVVPIPAPEPLPKDDPPPVIIPDQIAPIVIVPVPVQPARPKPKPKPRAVDDDDDERPARSRGQQPACKPITVDCNTVCSYAGRFSLSTLESMGLSFGYCPPTASQRAQGKACIRKQCPDVLKP